jgi:DNA-binding CsgD family transcriptional regulator
VYKEKRLHGEHHWFRSPSAQVVAQTLSGEIPVLTQIRPSVIPLSRPSFVPELLLPLVTAANNQESLERGVLEITRGLGFDSFMYGISTSHDPVQESKSYVFTTLPKEWVLRYDQQAYIEIDPRVRHWNTNSTPLIWDRYIDCQRSERTEAFLEDAARHGVGSGVAFALHAAHNAGVGVALVALNSGQRSIDDARRREIVKRLGDILLFGVYFHDLFMKNVVGRGIAPRTQGVPLSEREKQCLTLAAHGHTSHDIAIKLDIAERTVQFHFDSIRSKLAAGNRQEAIAKAIGLAIIRP